MASSIAEKALPDRLAWSDAGCNSSRLKLLAQRSRRPDHNRVFLDAKAVGEQRVARMRGLEGKLARLRAITEQVRNQDPELAEESEAAAPDGPAGGSEAAAAPAQALGRESIIMRRERPVLAIKENAPELEFKTAADSAVWKQRLINAASGLKLAIPAVGRIELQGGSVEWVGTGWLVRDDILVTNRHVAQQFVRRNGAGFTFRDGDGGQIVAAVDFLQEIGSDEARIFELVRPIHIEEEPGPDVAFFKVKPLSGNDKLSPHIKLASTVAPTNNAAVIGYPAYDSRIPDADLMEDIYGQVYNKKRFAPGGVTRVDDRRLFHNCTTLGGNSGSVVLDLDSGEALGLHFSGSFLVTNYAVRAEVVAELLDKAERGGGIPRSSPAAVRAEVPIPGGAGTQLHQVTIPLTVTVSVGDPVVAPRQSPARRPAAADPSTSDIAGEEGVAADYRGRRGYVPGFLGFEVPLPVVVRGRDDVLEFDFDGSTRTELRYEHFSTVMSVSRRMCIFSAVNIDGGLSRKTKRVGWKWDPRIPRERQIMNECYGSPPRFSRGHMTRREDPAWGQEEAAKRGNADSMHITNITPQMQAFNSPIWLGLEDYALQHARDDDMKISVFTGPYFTESDPVRYGVLIPTRFWKVIAFIHDDTRQLCTTGYEMDQLSTLPPEEEFVFGPFTSSQLGITTQVSIASIAERAGVDFGPLPDVDPFVAANEGRDGGATPCLATFEQIRFV